MSTWELDVLEVGNRAAWELTRDRNVTRLDTWLHLRRDVPWLHKGQGTLI